MPEKDWRTIFQVEQVEQPFHVETEASECNGNCLEAKELVCVCKCKGRNHGAALKHLIFTKHSRMNFRRTN